MKGFPRRIFFSPFQQETRGQVLTWNQPYRRDLAANGKWTTLWPVRSSLTLHVLDSTIHTMMPGAGVKSLVHGHLGNMPMDQRWGCWSGIPSLTTLSGYNHSMTVGGLELLLMTYFAYRQVYSRGTPGSWEVATATCVSWQLQIKMAWIFNNSDK